MLKKVHWKFYLFKFLITQNKLQNTLDAKNATKNKTNIIYISQIQTVY